MKRGRPPNKGLKKLGNFFKRHKADEEQVAKELEPEPEPEGPEGSGVCVLEVQSEQNLMTSNKPIRCAKIRALEIISDVSAQICQSMVEERVNYFEQIRISEDSQVRAIRLEEQRQRDANRRAAEEEDKRARRLEEQRQRDVNRRAAEEEDKQARRLKELRQAAAIRRAAEDEDERVRRLKELRQAAAIRRAAEDEDERVRRLEELRQAAAIRRASENEDERVRRLEEQRQIDANRRDAEVVDERAQRLLEQRRRTAEIRQNSQRSRLPTYKAAASSLVEYSNLGMYDIACVHCGAVHFLKERVQNRIHPNSFGDCCLHGRIEQAAPEFPNELALLYTKQHRLAKQFHDKIRNISACFAFSSFNVADDRTFNSKGIYTFTAGGQVYHKLNLAAQPVSNSEGDLERPRYGQMYFIDPETAVAERMNEPMNQGINQELIQILEEVMRSQNPFSQAFMMMREIVEENNQRAAALGVQPPHVHLLFAERAGDDPRRFNSPTYNEVAAVITLNADQSIPENEMVIKERGKQLITLKNIDSRVEPFTYPLLYPKGTFGFTVGLPLKTPYASRAHMTRMELAQYRLAFRPEQAKALPPEPLLEGLDLRSIGFNALHFGGRLFQQYVVDTYIRVERDRIQWIKYNQKKLQADQYAGVTHFLNELAEKKNATVAEKLILPSSFPGSTRYFTEHFEDAMAIVRRFGSPDFFITITCSPTWPELKEAACIELSDGSKLQQFAQERPDIVARVAKLKFDSIVEDISKKQIFGKSSAFVYTIEFQKRGLPHLHLLVIMANEDKLRSPEEVDTFISAEIPNDDPVLRELVLKWMIHNPCGEVNPSASCMENKGGSAKCRFGFPKAHQEFTSIVDNKKPNYKRQYDPQLDPNNPEFSHVHAVYRKNSDGQKVTRDNRHVAPYNGYLLKKYMCHINIEYVGSVRAVKYLYKYIYKGHDCANVKIVENVARIMYNEAETFVEARYISPPEACWRLAGNEIQRKSHSVQRLDIHLEGQYRVGNMEQTQEDVADTGLKGSTLEAYFKHNSKLHIEEENGNEVIYYFYWQMPEKYKWLGKTSEWVVRQRSSKTIGRIHTVNLVAQPELYHLRMLLFHTKDAKKNPKRLWDMFKDELAEDFLREAEISGTPLEDAYNRAYRIIAYKLNTEATEGRNFRFWVENYGMDDINDFEMNEEVFNVGQSHEIGHRLYNNLNDKQKEFVDAVIQTLDDESSGPKCFFLDGPGGTGKTFVYNTLYHLCRSRNIIVKCMAFTGIASILLPEGRTTHKTFGLKVPLTNDSKSSIKRGSSKFKELEAVNMFMMDEAPMLPKYGLDCMDELLRDLSDRNSPFGGKIMILGGDFRQCLPVQPRANRTELLDLSIKKSVLWRYFRVFSLEQNMRVDAEEECFARYLLKLGNGELDTNADSEIELPNDIITNTNDIVNEIYGECLSDGNFEDMKDRAILAPLNKDVDTINNTVINLIPGTETIYKSYDSIKDEPEGALKFPPEFLNSIEISDLPPHQLRLKSNTIIMLLRNLDVSEGLCNGTRLIVTALCPNIIKAKIITGEHSGRDVHIPRITLDSCKSQL
ncbi:uncharacterized protein LOC129004674 [Macrosteles quadrilineatus]|uniref:uncharacterized protein LOC129004674 n=1 Tax=Macrosteles quadrilineatus TaxID=74068 RepID=UPI0023E30E8D|nr:uncharacterized protein LOC129004674 [Macrosteles quadrilineatus]